MTLSLSRFQGPFIGFQRAFLRFASYPTSGSRTTWHLEVQRALRRRACWVPWVVGRCWHPCSTYYLQLRCMEGNFLYLRMILMAVMQDLTMSVWYGFRMQPFDGHADLLVLRVCVYEYVEIYMYIHMSHMSICVHEWYMYKNIYVLIYIYVQATFSKCIRSFACSYRLQIIETINKQSNNPFKENTMRNR